MVRVLEGAAIAAAAVAGFWFLQRFTDDEEDLPADRSDLRVTSPPTVVVNVLGRRFITPAEHQSFGELNMRGRVWLEIVMVQSVENLGGGPGTAGIFFELGRTTELAAGQDPNISYSTDGGRTRKSRNIPKRQIIIKGESAISIIPPNGENKVVATLYIPGPLDNLLMRAWWRSLDPMEPFDLTVGAMELDAETKVAISTLNVHEYPNVFTAGIIPLA